MAGAVPARAWDPEQYLRFRDERSLPFLELLSLVKPRPGWRIVDLGCGTGELTARLHEHLAAVDTLGLDSSGAMLKQARPLAGGGLRFEARDIGSFPLAHEQYDLVFSNAALQWVPDHSNLLPRLASAVAPGGQLAIQMPDQQNQPSHVAATEVAQEAPFRDALNGHVRIFPVLAPEAYAAILDELGFAQSHVRLQVFGHHLASREDVVEWVKGSLLTDYRQRLSPSLFEQFLDRYREVLMPRLKDRRPFFFPYRRILIWASR